MFGLWAGFLTCVFAQHSVFSNASWTTTISNTSNDLAASLDATSCGTGTSNGLCVYRFINVNIPRGATIRTATFLAPGILVWGNGWCNGGYGCYQYVQVQLLDNAPSLALPFDSASLSSAIAVSLSAAGAWIDVASLIQQIVSRPGWVFGNSISVTLKGAGCNWLCPTYGFYMYPIFNSTLNVDYSSTTPISQSTTSDYLIYPLNGSWLPSIGTQLNLARTSSNASIGINLNSITRSMFPSPFIKFVLTVQGKLTDVSLRDFSCANAFMEPVIYPQSIPTHSCNLPCLGGTYRFNIDFCWVVDGVTIVLDGLTVTHNLATTPCFRMTTNGTVTYPFPTLLDGTLLPVDGRDYNPDAGLLNATASSQNLNNRNAVLATFVAQNMCMDTTNSWMSVWLGTTGVKQLRQCSVRVGVISAMPPNMLPDSTVGAVQCPACSEAACPQGVLFLLTFSYAGGLISTRDSLFYPSLPLVMQVQGCVDNGARTTMCSTEGGTVIKIIMERAPGFNTTVTVLVGNLPCDFVSFRVTSTEVTCYLPESVGLLQSVRVAINGFVSPPVDYVSYAPPKITNITGGVGCSLGLANASSVISIQNCSRDGSTDQAITVRGINFGPLDVTLSVTFNSVSVSINRSEFEPHREFSFYLEPGLGSNLVLMVLVGGRQSDSALLSYEPCPLGYDAFCKLCALGRYGSSPGVCTKCSVGRYQNAFGQKKCIDCSRGFYQFSEESYACEQCPRTMTTFTRGSRSSTECEPCPYPYFVANVAGGDLECQLCPSNSAPTDGSFACQCLAGFFDKDSYGLPNLFDASKLVCLSCPKGADCSKIGNRHDTMQPIPGWWRSSVSHEFYECLKGENCPVVSNITCAPFRHGVLCAACESGYRDTATGGICEECSGSTSTLAWVSVGLVLIAVVVIGTLFSCQRFSLEQRARTRAMSCPNPGPLQPSGRSQSIVPAAKLLVGFLQVTTSMSSSFLSLPTGFVQVMQALDFINFSFVPFDSICFSLGFYTRLYITCLYPIAILFLLALVIVVPIYCGKQQSWDDPVAFQTRRQRVLDRARNFILFCTFMLYPQITLALLQVGICFPVDNEYYLMADVSQKCFQEEWWSQLGPVVVLFLLVPVGVPLAGGVMLYRNRDGLKSPVTLRRLGFLYAAYHTDSWWFELFEIVYKVCLISVVRFFSRDIQAPVRMGICFVYLVTVLLSRPFLQATWERLALFCSLEIMLISLLLHVLPVIGEWRGTYIDTLLTVLLLILVFSVILFCCFLIFRGSQWFKNHPKMQSYLTQTQSWKGTARFDVDDPDTSDSAHLPHLMINHRPDSAS